MGTVFAVLLALALNTGFLILMMHLSGRWFGIDFGYLKPAVGKVILFILVTTILSEWLGPVAFLINFFIWTVGFKIAFNLDWTELIIFTVSYAVGNFLLWILLVTVLLVLLS